MPAAICTVGTQIRGGIISVTFAFLRDKGRELRLLFQNIVNVNAAKADFVGCGLLLDLGLQSLGFLSGLFVSLESKIDDKGW